MTRWNTLRAPKFEYVNLVTDFFFSNKALKLGVLLLVWLLQCHENIVGSLSRAHTLPCSS